MSIAVVLAAATSVAVADTVVSTPSSSPSFDGPVHAVAYSGETVYVGGAFGNVVVSGRLIGRQRLAAFNVRTGALLSWNPGANGTVNALAVAGGTLYAAGGFTVLGGKPRGALAAITSAGTVTAFHPELAGLPATLATGNGLLYAGGRFTTVDGAVRSNAAAFSLTTGKVAAWAPRADDAVMALAVRGSRVYLGGRFRSVGGLKTARHLAAVTAGTGTLDNHFLPNPAQVVYGLAADASGVYAAHGGSGGRLVAYNTSGVPRWVRLFDGDAQSVVTSARTVYVGGHFDKACTVASSVEQTSCPAGTVPRGKLAAFTPAGGLTSWAPQANGVIGVRVVAADAGTGQVAAGGDFTTIGGATRKRFAAFATSSPGTPDRSASPLVAAYDFDAVAGAGSFTDTTGNGHLLQVFSSGGATLQTIVRGTGRAVRFPARCTVGCPHLVLQAVGSADLNPGNGPIRYGARVKLAADQTDDGENILQKGYSTVGGQYKLQVDKLAGRPSCAMTSAGDTTIHLAKSSQGVADGRWHTLECRRAGTRLSILVDDAVTGTITVPATLTVDNTAPLVLGGKGLSDNNDQYHGYLDDAWISLS